MNFQLIYFKRKKVKYFKWDYEVRLLSQFFCTGCCTQVAILFSSHFQSSMLLICSALLLFIYLYPILPLSHHVHCLAQTLAKGNPIKTNGFFTPLITNFSSMSQIGPQLFSLTFKSPMPHAVAIPWELGTLTQFLSHLTSRTNQQLHMDGNTCLQCKLSLIKTLMVDKFHQPFKFPFIALFVLFKIWRFSFCP